MDVIEDIELVYQYEICIWGMYCWFLFILLVSESPQSTPFASAVNVSQI